MKTSKFTWLMVAVFAVLCLSHCANVRAQTVEYNRARPYHYTTRWLWSESQVAQTAWPSLSFAGRDVECARISIYPNWIDRNQIPRGDAQYVVVRLDTGRKVKPSPRHFVRQDPGPGR
jgi:hypothetical protein